jgi:hypothetical protein
MLALNTGEIFILTDPKDVDTFSAFWMMVCKCVDESDAFKPAKEKGYCSAVHYILGDKSYFIVSDNRLTPALVFEFKLGTKLGQQSSKLGSVLLLTKLWWPWEFHLSSSESSSRASDGHSTVTSSLHDKRTCCDFYFKSNTTEHATCMAHGIQKKQYHEMALRHHPDKNNGNPYPDFHLFKECYERHPSPATSTASTSSI